VFVTKLGMQTITVRMLMRMTVSFARDRVHQVKLYLGCFTHMYLNKSCAVFYIFMHN